ncbi:Heme chaperone HemW [uncultured Gammaproteobacteria bacterium]
MTDLSLYLHWPFCRSKCPYCDFNSHVRDQIDQERWRRALLAELDHAAAQVGGQVGGQAGGQAGPGRRLASVFFGGGTPTLMEPGTVAAILDHAAGLWSPAADIEITLEGNPTSVETGRLHDFRSAGVNRVSLGVQALNDADLAALGRRHSAAEALAALDQAYRLFSRVSFDLIYARPGQTLAAWRHELGQALALAGGVAGGHLSLYQLTIEPGTAFHPRHARGELVLPDDDAAADLFELTQELTAAAGLPAYEISNHARPGVESRHNLIYWRSGDWIGLGPGAHGRSMVDGRRTAVHNLRAPEAWLAQVERCGHGQEDSERLSPQAYRDEVVMMGLRLAEGLPQARLDGLPPLPQDVLKRLIAGGFLVETPDRLTATAAGRQRLNALLTALCSYNK